MSEPDVLVPSSDQDENPENRTPVKDSTAASSSKNLDSYQPEEMSAENCLLLKIPEQSSTNEECGLLSSESEISNSQKKTEALSSNSCDNSAAELSVPTTLEVNCETNGNEEDELLNELDGFLQEKISDTELSSKNSTAFHQTGNSDPSLNCGTADTLTTMPSRRSKCSTETQANSIPNLSPEEGPVKVKENANIIVEQGKNGSCLTSPEKRSNDGSESSKESSEPVSPNSLLNSSPNLDKIAKLYEKYSKQCSELERLEKQNSEYREQLVIAVKERDGFQKLIHDSQNAQTAKIQEVERKLLEDEYQMKAMKDRAAAQDAHFRKSMADLQAKHAAQIEQLKKSTDSAQREKNESVIKYAQREAEILNLEQSKNRLSDQLKQVTKERDALTSGLRGAKNEKTALQATLEQRESDLMDVKRELERKKSQFSEADIRVKLATDKQNEAEAAQKEIKTELEKCQRRLTEAKEESETVRADCQRIIKQYQEQQEKKFAEISIQQREHSDQAEIYQMVSDELDALKRQHKDVLKELQELRDKSGSLEGQLSRKEAELSAEKSGRSQDLENLERIRELAEQTESSQRQAIQCEESMTRALEERDQAEKESAANREQAEKMLELTEQLSAKNSALAAENNAFRSKVEHLEEKNELLSQQLKEVMETMNSQEHELSELKACTSAEISSLQNQLSEKITKEQELSTQVEDERNLNKVLKKKQAASMKDLKNELSNMKRRLDAYETGGHHVTPDGTAASISSRASSVTSLDVASAHASSSRVSEDNHSGHGVQIGANSEGSPGSAHGHGAENSGGQAEHVNCVHNQAMIEKIVKLQRQLARRSEKIEFLEEHVKQLVDEMQKKSKIVQMFALREESGALVPESVDINKAQMAQRGDTVMGSVFNSGVNQNSNGAPMAQGGKGVRRSSAAQGPGFNSHAGHHVGSDSKLTLELSMEINGKLQAVLEDTLLKNITLKDNMETLGQEISRLSRENREMRLAFEQKKL